MLQTVRSQAILSGGRTNAGDRTNRLLPLSFFRVSPALRPVNVYLDFEKKG